MINLSSYKLKFFLFLILCTLFGCDNESPREAINQTTSSIPNYDPDDWSYESDLVYHKYMAEKNDVKSLEELYKMFSSGRGIKKDYSLAIAYLKKASSLGSYSASYQLASHYEYGVPKGVTRSDFILVKNLEVSANYKKLYISQLTSEAESDPLAAFKLGNRYETKETDVVKSQIYYDKSRVLLEEKVAENEPYWTLLYATFRGEPKNPSILQNSEQSLSLLEQLVEQKYRKAYPYLASVYMGRELPKVREFALQKYGLSNESAYKKAKDLLLIGAEKGDMESIKLLLGYYQKFGKFEKHVDEQIIKWADEGIKQSKYNEIDNVRIHAAKINSAYKLRDAELLAKSMLSSLEFEDFSLYRGVSKNSYLLFLSLIHI